MNILDSIFLVVSCPGCNGSYDVPASVAGASDKMLHDGCPVTNPLDCPERHYPALVDPRALEDLGRAFERVEESAHSRGCSIVLRASPTR